MGDATGASGRAAARVEALVTAPAAGEAMVPVPQIEVRTDGVVGDRYARGTGFWQDRGDSPLTLIDAADVAAAADDLGVVLDPLVLRRNVVVRGANLLAWQGRRFRLGEVVLEGDRPCDPCMYLERAVGVAGLKKALGGRGGLRVRVIEGGILRVGDCWQEAGPGTGHHHG